MIDWLRWLPLPNYYKTLLWSASIKRPRRDVADWPYYRSIQLAMSSLKSGRGVIFPKAHSYTMLEFGVASGKSFGKMLHFRDILARRLGVTQPITCIGFDTFTGLPAKRPEDTAAPWIEGDFAADFDAVRSRLARNHSNFEFAKGLFTETLPVWRDRLIESPPLFVSIDCDYYSSTMDVFKAILPLTPTGCMFYFDDPQIHFWSDRAGEVQAVREVNEGCLGKHLSFTEYPLWIETRELRHYRQLYRFINMEKRGFTVARALTADEALTLAPVGTAAAHSADSLN